VPCLAAPSAPLPNSLFPNCDHTPAERVNIHAPPAPELSLGPPTRAVLPSKDKATEAAKAGAPLIPLGMSVACCVQVPLPLRVNTSAVTIRLSSGGAPTMAVLPSPDRPTDQPCSDCGLTAVPTSLAPCCQVPLLRTNIHAAPTRLLSLMPPTMAVLPSA